MNSTADSSFPPVSIIIPNYNGARLMVQNLPVVRQALNAYAGGGELIVVDDCSRDGSVEVLERQFSDVTLIRHDRNRGFSEAVHSGVHAARHELLIFLNSDVQPEASFIAPLASALREDDVFAAAPLINRETGACDPNSLNCYSIRGGRLRRLRGPYADASLAKGPRPSLYASGGSVALRRSRFLELGGFLPIFHPFYWEDFDLGVRAWRRGWRIVSIPASRIVHQSHGGAIKENVAKRRIRRALQRNKLLVEWIHLAPSELPLFILRLIPRLLARAVSLDFGFVGALADALAKLPEARSIRRKLEANGAKPFAQILQSIEAQNRRLFDAENEV